MKLSRIRRRYCEAFAACAAMLCLGLVAAPLHALAATECVVQCDRGKQCDVVLGRDHYPLKDADVRRVDDCASATMTGGPVVGVFRGPRGLERFKIKNESIKFDQEIPALKSAACSISRNCIEDREMRRVAGVGGKGADEDRVIHDGRPCELGLPCGQILRPKQTVVIQLSNVTTGKFILAAKRGADKTPATFNVSGGRVELPADKLAAGAVYTYELQGAPSAVRGEFSVMSTKMQNDVEKAIADSRRTEPDQSALGEVEILMEEDLQWDAAQKLN